MKYKLFNSVLVSVALLISSVSNAGVIIDHTYDINFDGSTYLESYIGDLNLEQGGTVQLNFIADDNDYWNNMIGSWFWSALYLGNSGSRVGDYNWSYLLNGTIASGGSVLGNESSSAHFINIIDTYSGMFDQLTINYSLTSSTTGNTNTLIDDPSFWFQLVPFQADYVNNKASTDVPEPSTLAIFALGMIGLASRRFKK